MEEKKWSPVYEYPLVKPMNFVTNLCYILFNFSFIKESSQKSDVVNLDNVEVLLQRQNRFSLFSQRLNKSFNVYA